MSDDRWQCVWGVTLRHWQTRTHCCGHIVADTNVSPFARARNICCGHKLNCVRDTKNVSDFVQKHFVSATNVSQFVQPKKHHEQQCVCNSVSMFASTFKYCQTRTHCCGHIVANTNVSPFACACNICAQHLQHNFVSGTQNMFLILSRNILCPQEMFPSLRVQGNIMSNNVSATMFPHLPPPLNFPHAIK